MGKHLHSQPRPSGGLSLSVPVEVAVGAGEVTWAFELRGVA